MIMDDGIADAGEMDAVARLGLRSGLLNRRSFLLGSAAGLNKSRGKGKPRFVDVLAAYRQ